MISLEQTIGIDDLVLFEDDPERLNDLEEQFEAKGISIHVAKSVDQVLEFQYAGARYFVLDGKYRDDLKAGAKAARSLKHKDPLCFVAILTRYPESFQELEYPVELLLRKESPNLRSEVEKIWNRMLETELERDVNHQAFLHLMKEPALVDKYNSMYVGFVEGEFAGFNESAVALVEELDRAYPSDDVPKYYNLVQKAPTVRRALTPLRKHDR